MCTGARKVVRGIIAATQTHGTHISKLHVAVVRRQLLWGPKCKQNRQSRTLVRILIVFWSFWSFIQTSSGDIQKNDTASRSPSSFLWFRHGNIFIDHCNNVAIVINDSNMVSISIDTSEKSSAIVDQYKEIRSNENNGCLGIWWTYDGNAYSYQESRPNKIRTVDICGGNDGYN